MEQQVTLLDEQMSSGKTAERLDPIVRENLFGRVALLQMRRASCDAPEWANRRGPCGFTNDKLRLDGDLWHIFAASLNLIHDRLRRDLPHPDQRLPHGR